METRRPQRSNRIWLVMAILVVAGAGIYYYVTRNDTPPDAGQPAGPVDAPQPARQPGAAAANDNAGQSAQPSQPAAPTYEYRRIEGMTPQLAAGIGPSPITVTPIGQAEATAAFTRGMEAYRAGDDLIEARTLLNRACTRGNLPAAQAKQARDALTELADATILRRDPYVNPKDPYLQSYTFEFGDLLLSRRGPDGRVTQPGIIARLDLNTPADIIVWANGLRKGGEFKANRAYKMIKGPFHVVVDLSEFAADLYVQDLFLRRMPVCIGAPETPTPTGYFRVPRGGKTSNSPYNAPVETGLPNIAILPGEPGYPLGPRGLNIKLEGIRQLGTGITANQSYAIHGTSEPASVGTASSRGCVRLRADDIRLIYSALMDYATPGDPKVSWTRYSTVTIRK
jgi:hypothetical protein